MSPSCNWTKPSCNKGGCILYTECTQVHYSKTRVVRVQLESDSVATCIPKDHYIRRNDFDFFYKDLMVIHVEGTSRSST
jgi:hypothetical protein